MDILTLWLVFLASLFATAANIWRLRRSRNKYGRMFHLLVALTSGYFMGIFALTIAGVLDAEHFGPIFARPATIILLTLLGAYAIAYPNLPDK